MKKILFCSLVMLIGSQSFSAVANRADIKDKRTNPAHWLSRTASSVDRSVADKNFYTGNTLLPGGTINLSGLRKSITSSSGRTVSVFANELSVVTAINATEGGAAGSFTVSLPGGVNATENITVSYTVGGTATSATDYTALSGTATILNGQNSVTITVTPANDQIIEQTETVTLTITGGAGAVGTYNPLPGSETASLNINDDDNNAGNKVLSVVRTAHGAEPGSNGQFRLQLPAGITSSEAVTVNYTITGTATSGTDYTSIGTSATIPAGQNSVLVDVTVQNDQTIESTNETVILTITGGSSGSFTFTASATLALRSTSLNITDDDNVPANMIITYSKISDATEGGADGKFRISLPTGIDCQCTLSLTYGFAGSTANLPPATNPDFMNPGTLTINPGNNHTDYTIAAVNDNFIEHTETVVVTNGATIGVGGLVGVTAFTVTGSPITLNINDDDNTPINRTISISKAADASPGASGGFRIGLPSPYILAEDIAVSYTVGGTAAPGTDYSTLTGTATILAGQNSVAVPVTPTPAASIAGTETVIASLTGATSPNFSFTTGGSATVDITDNASRTLSVANTGNATEGGAAGSFSISLSGGQTATENITVSYTVGGTALPGTDYTTLTGTATILTGQNSVAVAVIPVNDQVIEQTKTLSLTLTGGASANFSFTPAAGSAGASVDILDDDNTGPNTTLSVVRISNGAETPANGQFSIRLPAGITSSEDIMVNYTMSGTATSGTDYTSPAGTAMIPSGQNNVLVDILVLDDNSMEPLNETAILTLAGATSPNFSYTATSNISLNITDNDNVVANRKVTLTKIADAAEGGTSGTFRLSLPTGLVSQGTITANINYNGSTAELPGATNADFLTPGTLVITPGNNYVDFSISAVDDNFIENVESVVINPVSATATGIGVPVFTWTSTTPVTINIDDNPAKRKVTASVGYDGTEGGVLQAGQIRVNFALGAIPSEAVTIQYTLSGGAVSGTDYTGLTGSDFDGVSTIAANGTGETFDVADIVNDAIIEGTETVVVTITSVTSPNFSYTFSSPATIRIFDNDSAPASMQLAVTKTADAAEPGTSGSFSISLPAGLTATENITANYTLGGTATSGADYVSLANSVVIPAGQNSVPLPVTVSDDQKVEATETLNLTITGGSSTSFTFTPDAANASASMNIADDDNINANKIVSIVRTGHAAEPAGNGAFNVQLPAGITADEDVNINYTVAGTAAAGTDYMTLPGSVIIPAGQNAVTVPVQANDDHIIEETETVTVTLTSASSASFSFMAVGSATLDMTDDDDIPANRVLSIGKTEDASEPAKTGSLAISLPAGIAAVENITVNYTVSGTAAAGTDYAALTGTATILAGQNSVSIPVTPVNDQIIELVETVSLAITGGTDATGAYTPAAGNATASVNIADDDDNAVNRIVSISKTADASEPATNAGFMVSLPAGISAAETITVTYNVAGTAAPGTDYTALSGSAMIPPGQNSAVIPVSMIDDTIYEPAETLILTLTGGTSASFAFTTSLTNATATAAFADDERMDQVISFNTLPVKMLGDPAFSLDAVGGASGNPVTYKSSNPAVATVSGNIVTIVGVGTTTITASQAGNATNNAAADVSQVLTVTPPNTAPTLAAIADQSICFTNTLQNIALTGISAGAESGQTTTLSVTSSNNSLFSNLSVAGGSGSTGTFSYTLAADASGMVTITITVRDNGGTQNGGVDTFSRTFTLTISPMPQIQISADPGTTISKGETVQLTASGSATYSWGMAPGIIGVQNSATLTVRPSQTTTYTVTGISSGGCPGTAMVTITVNEDYKLEANNVITPNGDGKNDFFVIKNIDMYPNNEVRIIDRAGRAVYNKKGYSNDWDGTLNGMRLDENTYYYIIDLGKGVKAIKGFITIVRNN